VASRLNQVVAGNRCVVNNWASVLTLSILKSCRILKQLFIEASEITLHHVLLGVVDASEFNGLASSSRISVSINGDIAKSYLGSLDISANSNIIDNSTCLG